MKIRADRDSLAEAVAWAARALPARPPVPVLAGLHLSAADGVLHLSAFDYEVSARVDAGVDVLQSGTVLVSGRLLSEIVKALPNRPVDMVSDGSRVTLTCGSSKFTLLTMPVEEYPQTPAMPPTLGVVPGPVFVQAVGQVTVAASKDDTLPILTGIRVEFGQDEITLMSTDRYRLAVRTLEWRPDSRFADPVGVLVKGRTLSEVAKSLGAVGDVTVSLSDDAGMVGFQVGGRRTTSLLLDGEYPKVASLFPDKYAGTAVVDVAVLTDAVKRVALVAERNTPARLSWSDGSVLVEAGQGEDAQAVETVECTLSGDPMVQAYNPGFLLDGLAAVPQPYARVSFAAPLRPAVITGQVEADGDDDPAFRYLLMPVKLGA